MADAVNQDAAAADTGRLPPGQSPPSYPVRACFVCSRKKTRCDMVRPTCGLCKRTNTECTFPLKRKVPVVRKPRTTSKANKVNENLERLVQLLEGQRSPDNPHSGKDFEQVVARPEQQYRSQEPNSPAPTLAPWLITTPSLELLPEIGRNAERGPDDSPMADYQLHQNAPGLSCSPQQSIGRLPDTPPCDDPIPVSYLDAMHLVNVFFERIQPWLPLLQMPQFKDYCARRLRHDKDALQDLSTEERLLYYAIFSMAARFSKLPHLSRLPPTQRGLPYAKLAMQAYNETRSENLRTSLVYLQGCIILAYHYYTSGLCATGWILVGVCVRLAYDLGLSDIDDESSEELPPDLGWVELEEYRRAWWLVWELDSFGSIVSQRPFAIDRRRICVKLPISDEAWFARREVTSGLLITRIGDCWKSLLAVENQDERAWFLISNFLLTSITDRSLVRESATPEEIQELEDTIRCLTAYLPPSFTLDSHYCGFDYEPANKTNFFIGTHFMLALASLTVACMKCGDVRRSPGSHHKFSETQFLPHMNRLSTIVSRWKPEHILSANPFFAPCMAPVLGLCTTKAKLTPAFASYLEIACTVQARMAENWKFAATSLHVLKLSLKTAESEDGDFELAKRHPFCRSLRKSCRTRTPSSEDMQSMGHFSLGPHISELLDDQLTFENSFADILTDNDQFVNTATQPSLFAIPTA